MKVRAIAGAAALAITLCAVAFADPIRVRVDGNSVQFYGTQPMMLDGHVMVPLRGVMERLGATVDWMAGQNTVEVTRGDTTIDLPVGSDTATINGRQVPLEAPATAIDGRTMVPLRFVSESLGADVRWVNDTQTVLIDSGTTFNAYRTPDNSYQQSYGGWSDSLPAGTVVPARLDDRLSSQDNAAGDQFTATVERGRAAAGLPAGTTFEGVIRQAVPARSRRPGVLEVDFRRITLPDGQSRRIDASLMSLNGKYVSRTSSGRIVARSNHRNDQMKWIGIGAGAGLLISAVAGGNALINSLLGGGAGYLYNQFQHRGPSNVVIKPGTRIGIRLNQQVAFGRRRE